MKRTAAWLLTLALVLPLLSACSDGGGEAEDLPDSPVPLAQPAEDAAETEPAIADDVPAADFEGYAFRIGASAENNADYLHYTYTEEMNGEGVNDAVFNANTYVRDKYNIDIVWSDTGDSHFNAYQHVINSVHAGDDAYDCAILHDHASVTAMLEGVLLNLNELPAVDTSKPWWPAFTVNALTVNGKLYFNCSSLKYDALASTRAVFMNQDIAAELNLAIPYDMVREGTWTMDVMREMSEKAYIDVNGDGTKDAGDRYGWAISGHTYDYMEGFGTDIYKHADDGKSLYLDFYNDHNLKIITQSCSWFFGGGNDVWFDGSGSNKENVGALKMFAEGQSLFSYNSVIRHVRSCADADMTYSILPQPKLDETQTVYYGGTNDHPLVVPVTCSDHDRTGLILESMAYAGKTNVEPAYIEVAMKTRYAADPDTAEMLEMIFNNRLVSAGYFYSNLDTLSMAHDVFWMKGGAEPEIASWYKSQEKMENKRVEKINKFFADGE